MKPGLYDGIPDAEYHGDKDTLSVSGAKKLLPPSCPARFHYEREHGQPPKDAFDFGHAAHRQVLGAGAELAVCDFPDWRSKEARTARDQARERGEVPVLVSEARQVIEMAAAIKAHPIASVLLDPEHGRPEVSGYWQDEQHDVTRRFRLDWLPETDGGRLIVPDFKTCQSAEPAAFARAAFNFGYDQQAQWYMDGIRALGVAEDVSFVFIAQEKTAPYLVTVFELDTEALRIGGVKNDRALSVYAECMATDTWPSYASDVELIGPPAWMARQFEGAA